MIAKVFQVQLWLNDVEHHPGICKGQRRAEKGQDQSERLHLRRLHRETSLPTVLRARSRSSEWVCYFLLSQSEKTMPPFCLLSHSVPSDNLPLSHLDCVVSYVTRAPQQDHLRKNARMHLFCRPDLSSVVAHFFDLCNNQLILIVLLSIILHGTFWLLRMQQNIMWKLTRQWTCVWNLLMPETCWDKIISKLREMCNLVFLCQQLSSFINMFGNSVTMAVAWGIQQQWIHGDLSYFCERTVYPSKFKSCLQGQERPGPVKSIHTGGREAIWILRGVNKILKKHAREAYI